MTHVHGDILSGLNLKWLKSFRKDIIIITHWHCKLNNTNSLWQKCHQWGYFLVVKCKEGYHTASNGSEEFSLRTFPFHSVNTSHFTYMCHWVKESCQFPFISSGLQNHSPLNYMSLIAFLHIHSKCVELPECIDTYPMVSTSESHWPDSLGNGSNTLLLCYAFQCERTAMFVSNPLPDQW